MCLARVRLESVRTRVVAVIAVIVLVAGGLTAHVLFYRTGNAVTMWTAAFLLWPAYVIRTAFSGSKSITLAILAAAATIYYAAIAAGVILSQRRVAAAILAAHLAGTAVIGSMMAQILDVARTMEALQD